MAWTQPALQLTQDNGKVMGSQESGSASCRAYWTGWEKQSQKSDNREAQMNSGCISRTLFSEPGGSWGAVQGHQTETQALAVVSAEARPASVAKGAELWLTWRMGKNCSLYKYFLEKETILQFWENGFDILWAPFVTPFLKKSSQASKHGWMFWWNLSSLYCSPWQVKRRPKLLKSPPAGQGSTPRVRSRPSCQCQALVGIWT